MIVLDTNVLWALMRQSADKLAKFPTIFSLIERSYGVPLAGMFAYESEKQSCTHCIALPCMSYKPNLFGGKDPTGEVSSHLSRSFASGEQQSSWP
jgi:hypothetical protein